MAKIRGKTLDRNSKRLLETIRRHLDYLSGIGGCCLLLVLGFKTNTYVSGLHNAWLRAWSSILGKGVLNGEQQS